MGSCPCQYETCSTKEEAGNVDISSLHTDTPLSTLSKDLISGKKLHLNKYKSMPYLESTMNGTTDQLITEITKPPPLS